MRYTEHSVPLNCLLVAQPSGQARSAAHGGGAQAASGGGDRGGYSEVGEREEKHINQDRQDGDALQPVQFASQNELEVLLC